MGRVLLRLCICALGVVPLVGCGDNEGTAGSGGSAGTGGMGGTGGVGGTGGTGGSGGTVGQVFSCTEQGIRDAIAEGGGPHTFDCDGSTTVVTAAEIVIDNDVILDGEGNLIVDGNEDHRVFAVPEGNTAELHGLSVRRGRVLGDVQTAERGGGIYNRDGATLTLSNSTVSGNSGVLGGGGIANGGTLTLTNSTVSGNTTLPQVGVDWGGGGIFNEGTLTLTNSTVVGNRANYGGGISNFDGTLTLTSSTVSGNTGGGIYNDGTLMLTNSTVSGNAGGGISISYYTTLTTTLSNTLVDNDCGDAATVVSGGGNLESPGDTCGFDQPTDQANVSAQDLKLGPLANNGGPTMTHALLPGSVAIDVIPEATCEVDTDQRGQPRPETGGTMCDVGAFEVQP